MTIYSITLNNRFFWSELLVRADSPDAAKRLAEVDMMTAASEELKMAVTSGIGSTDDSDYVYTVYSVKESEETIPAGDVTCLVESGGNG